MKFEVRYTNIGFNQKGIVRVEVEHETAVDAEIMVYFEEKYEIEYCNLDIEDGRLVSYENTDDGEAIVNIDSVTRLADDADINILEFGEDIGEGMAIINPETGREYEIKKINGNDVVVAEMSSILVYKKVYDNDRHAHLVWDGYKIEYGEEFVINIADLKGYNWN